MKYRIEYCIKYLLPVSYGNPLNVYLTENYLDFAREMGNKFRMFYLFLNWETVMK